MAKAVRQTLWVWVLFAVGGSAAATAPPFPPGFFVEDLSSTTVRPAFYNLETHRLERVTLRESYQQFIDFCWDRDRGLVFFSARHSAKDIFRIYVKSWPDGEERAVYETPVGPFRFLLSPDGQRFALQIMGPDTWPTLAIQEWQQGETVTLGQGYSPDWSADGQRLLYLQIPGSLPTRLAEYRVDTDSSTPLLEEPVMEAVYTDDPEQIILKTASQSKKCDVFKIWNRRKGGFYSFCAPEKAGRKERCASQRELGVFPGHQFFYFRESFKPSDNDRPVLVVTDVWGGRLQELDADDWLPRASAVEDTTLVVGQDPLYVLSADGTGGKHEIPNAGFIRVH